LILKRNINYNILPPDFSYFESRYYDSDLSVWLSVDPLSDKAPGWSPYRYGFNNPVRFIDPDGRFELDENTAKENPQLVNYLKSLVDVWNNKSQNFRDAFMETSGLTNDEVLEMITYGKGPKIEVKDLDKDTNGDGNIDRIVNGSVVALKDAKTGKLKNSLGGKGLIFLDNDIVSMLENAQSVKDLQIAMIMVESTLFHEGTHIGNIHKSGNAHGKYKESGKEFEIRTYGKDINRVNVEKYWESIQPKPMPSLKTNKIK